MQQIILQSNDEFSNTSDIEKLIQERDLEWKRNSQNIKPLVEELMNNQGALIARAVIENDQDSPLPIKNILITNAFGTNIILTNAVPDYIQSDEKWWEAAKINGIYTASGTNSEEYTSMYTSDISIPIVDSNGNFIGVIKAIVNVEKILVRE